jgi:hypothetical protein
VERFTKDMISTDKFLILENDTQRAYLILSANTDDYGDLKEPLGIIYKFGIDFDDVEELMKEGFINYDKQKSLITFYNIKGDSDYDG